MSEIGDVFALKSTLEELQLLAQVQKSEIAQMKVTNTQDPIQQELSEHVALLKTYQQHDQEQSTQIKALTAANRALADEL